MIDIEAVQSKLRIHHYQMAVALGVDPVYIVTENEAYTPTDGVPYKTMFMMLADIEDISIAFDDITNTKLIFQITLHYPPNIKTDEINAETNNILIRFKRGTVLNTASERISIERSPEYQDLGIVDNRNTRAISVYVDATEVS